MLKTKAACDLFYFFWTDKHGVPVTTPRGYTSCIDTAGMVAEAGRSAWHMISGTKDELKEKFGFQDNDFTARRTAPWRWMS